MFLKSDYEKTKLVSLFNYLKSSKNHIQSIFLLAIILL